MSFEQAARKAGRWRVTLLELDLDYCGLLYGQSPCTATLGPGENKCFNTRATCQDAANYDPAPKVYRFCELEQAELPLDLDALPFIVDWRTSPSRIDPDGGLGQRATCSVTLTDYPHHDRGLDKYARERLTGEASGDGVAFDPVEQGTFWGKFRARNPFYWGRTMRLITGFMNEAGEFEAGNFQTRHYIITNISGPSSNGRVTIEGRDPVKRADNERAQFPAPSPGVLAADIDESLDPFSLSPSGVGSKYPSSGKVRIGDEFISFTRSGDVITPTGRGVSNTEVDEHDSGSTVQLVGIVEPTGAQQIVFDLWTQNAGIDAAFIDKDQWDEEAADFFQFIYSAEIGEPTGVNELTRELCLQAGFKVFWDDRAGQYRISAVKPTPVDAPILSDSNGLIADSIRIQEQEDKRLTQVWVYHGLINPTQSIDEAENYRVRQRLIDDDAESPDQYNAPRVEKIFARWIPATAIAAARDVAQRRLSRFVRPPREISFSLDAKDADTWAASIRRIESRTMQTFIGGLERVPVEVLEVRDNGDNVFSYRALEYRVDPRPDDIPELIIGTDQQNYNVREQYEIQIAPIQEGQPIEVRVTHEAQATVNTIIGGGLPEGSLIRYDIYGDSVGLCGAGGDGGNALSFYEDEPGVQRWFGLAGPGGDGEDGQPAVIMSEDWIIRRFDDAVFAGGSGGGGGGAGIALADFAAGGGGGGGGRSIPNTSGGTGGSANINPPNASNTHPGEDGQPGTASGPGAGGAGGDGNDGGNGGGYASNGADGADGQEIGGTIGNEYGGPVAGGKGGSGAPLVITNGFSLTFTEGNDASHVFGGIQ